jgi:hypothetical protein
MARSRSLLLIGLMAFGTVMGSGAIVAQQYQGSTAQTTSPPVQTTSSPAQTGPDVASSDEGDNDNDRFPAFALTSVEVLRTTHEPKLDVVVAYGLTSSDGWTEAELVPLRHSDRPASDGVLDLVLEAQPPPESAEPTGYTPIQAMIPLEPGHPFKAVRVRAATNSILVHDLPGSAEAKQPTDPCKACIGKLFVSKGGAVPSGAAPGDAVREEDLPAGTRVVHPGDGLAATQPDPNRLTIVIGEDGRIVDAAWE